MTLDPTEIGQALAYVGVATTACVVAMKKMLSGWAKSQSAAQELERTEQQRQQRKERNRNRRTLQAAVRAELGRNLERHLQGALHGVMTRLEKVEHAVDAMRQRQGSKPPRPGAPTTKR